MANNLQDQFTVVLNVLGRLRPLAIVLVGTALMATMFAGNEVSSAVAAYRTATAVPEESVGKVKLVRQPLAAEDYTRYGGIIAGLVPGVRITVPEDGKSMHVAVADIGGYELWIYALNSLQSYSKNVVWEADNICLQDCGSETVASAQVRGYVQSLEIQ